ncbi:hypothetical protein [Halovivax gelatinilyticus]|uniref:hypothetical protein n=1 Tax=Halovivax gelatinilyticus TaxID=2961597 RepID=UPI0020CA8B33|nr:hypothetical protein [Halovivax gelatinilyticus]
MSTTDSLSNEAGEMSETMLTVIGWGSAVMYVVVFTAVGELALEDAVYGAVAGIIAGVGAFLFMPWFLQLSAIQNEAADDVAFSDVVDRATGSTQLGVLGFGLESGSILMLAAGFALEEPNLLVGAGAALGGALVVFALGSFVLDR